MNNMETEYKSGSLSLFGAIAMGTGVMIGAGIFALTGQVAELAGALFPLAFLAAAIISGSDTNCIIRSYFLPIYGYCYTLGCLSQPKRRY
ncbi:hypothetical protein [Rivularia sp. PCC 7116]|uniref:hypothetical protein n=1 Tax=Rivularia sp. PCC 7116 TaxID=373994 RepID=UPI000311D1C5|nr:hypothetical protein [Rivularia sp. PCC 7116]